MAKTTKQTTEPVVIDPAAARAAFLRACARPVRRMDMPDGEVLHESFEFMAIAPSSKTKTRKNTIVGVGYVGIAASSGGPGNQKYDFHVTGTEPLYRSFSPHGHGPSLMVRVIGRIENGQAVWDE